jgi:carboxymethylenebutenolidase
MIEQAIAIRTPDGTADGFLFQPETTGRWPGAIHLTDIAGIRPSEHDMCRRLSSEGYVVLMPNAFYRTGKPPLVDFPFKPGDEKTMNRISELKAPLTPEAIARDGSAYVDFLAAQESVKGGAMGIVGYCFTGAVALRIAADRPDKIAAAASFHGGGLFTEAPTSPHHVLPQVKARLYFGHAIEDRSMPKAAIENLEKALKVWGGKFESETYEGAHHSWTTPDSPVYDKKQADRAFGKLTDLFSATLR